MKEAHYIISFVTASNEAEAEKIANPLIEKGIAACVNIVPKIKSIYKWQGKIEYSEEVLLIIKSISRKFDELKEEVKRLHSYDVPEIISIDISNGSEGYLNWIDKAII